MELNFKSVGASKKVKLKKDKLLQNQFQWWSTESYSRQTKKCSTTWETTKCFQEQEDHQTFLIVDYTII